MRRSIRNRLRTREPTTALRPSPRPGRSPAAKGKLDLCCGSWRYDPASVHTLRPANQLGRAVLGGFACIRAATQTAAEPPPRTPADHAAAGSRARRRPDRPDPDRARRHAAASTPRQHRALTDYAGNVTQIVEETDQTSKPFFGKLSDPGSLSVTEFVAEVNADRSAMDSYTSRVDSLGRPRRHGQRPEHPRAGLRAAQPARWAKSPKR